MLISLLCIIIYTHDYILTSVHLTSKCVIGVSQERYKGDGLHYWMHQQLLTRLDLHFQMRAVRQLRCVIPIHTLAHVVQQTGFKCQPTPFTVFSPYDNIAPRTLKKCKENRKKYLV